MRNFVNIMQIRERNEEGMGRGFSRLAAHHSPLVRSRDVPSIALKTLGKERDCSQSRGIWIANLNEKPDNNVITVAILNF